jgi:CubicO group peptidase (beta-lactamase class C family)
MTKVSHSNLGYVLIGYLVEKISGMPLKQYMHTHLFQPLEMRETVFAPSPAIVEKLAIPYVFDESSGSQTPTAWLRSDGWPAGIVYGTITDLANWLKTNLNGGVFKNHRIVSEKTFTEMMNIQYPQFKGPIINGWLGESTGFGLSWWISQRKGDTYFAHSGAAPGYTAFLVGNLNQKTGFVILTNCNRARKHLFQLSLEALDMMRISDNTPNQ